jgi:Ca-activated chloride channel family protein
VSSVGFLHPEAFVIYLIFLLCERFCVKRGEFLLFPNISQIIQNQNKKSFNLISFLKHSFLFFLTLSLATPYIKSKTNPPFSFGHSIVLAIDASGSMKESFSSKSEGLSKFDITKELAIKFIKKREDDEIGLSIFADINFIASLITYDTKALIEILKSLKIGDAGLNYTKMFEALYFDAKLFSSKAKNKIIVLLTDGKSNKDKISLDFVLKYLKKMGIKVYAVGIGKDKDFDKEVLKKIANKSGGEFFEANSPRALEIVYDKIDALQKSKIKKDNGVKAKLIYEYFLFISILSLIFYIYFTNKKGRV